MAPATQPAPSPARSIRVARTNPIHALRYEWWGYGPAENRAARIWG